MKEPSEELINSYLSSLPKNGVGRMINDHPELRNIIINLIKQVYSESYSLGFCEGKNYATGT